MCLFFTIKSFTNCHSITDWDYSIYIILYYNQFYGIRDTTSTSFISITRNGTTIATNITGTTFTDTGLIVNTSYTYLATPYNSSGAGTTALTGIM